MGKSGRLSQSRAVAFLVGLVLSPIPSRAQLNYAPRFKLEKETYLVGEPVFCDYIIQNAGTETFAFPHRAPSRLLNPELEWEPRFVLTDAAGRRLADPAPQPCGGEKGRAIYGSITLPPGQTSVEGWVLNQWGRFDAPGRYHVHAERHLPLYTLDPATQDFSTHPAAYALAVDDLWFEVVPATENELVKAFDPLLDILHHPRDPRFAEAVIAITTVPHPFLEPQLVELAGKSSATFPWVRQQALEGLARLGTPSAWKAILHVALSNDAGAPRGGAVARSESTALRSYAVLLLSERGDPAFVPALLDLLRSGPEPLRQDVVRALGSFHDPRANRVLFDRLHSRISSDRVNAILALKSLNTKDAFPALLAMLNDQDEQVRQVANYALCKLTGQAITLPPRASRAELARVYSEWRGWWSSHNATFTPAPQPPCRDW